VAPTPKPMAAPVTTLDFSPRLNSTLRTRASGKVSADVPPSGASVMESLVSRTSDPTYGSREERGAVTLMRVSGAKLSSCCAGRSAAAAASRAVRASALRPRGRPRPRGIRA
jgi:hypothetical protein